MPIDDDRPRSSSSEEHSYIEGTMSPASSAPQTPSEINPPPQLSARTAAELHSPPPAPTKLSSSPSAAAASSPPKPKNAYILELYEAGVPFIRYEDLKITDKLGQVRTTGV